MPISVQTPSNSYVGNGSTTVFAFTFRLIKEADLKVYVDAALVATSEYVVSGVGDLEGGDVTFDTAPANGATVFIRREVTQDRDTDYQQGGALNSETLDNDLDRTIMMVQDLAASTLIAVEGEDLLDATNKRIINVADPVNDQDAATKAWVESSTAAGVIAAAASATNAQASAVAADASADLAALSEAAAATSEANAALSAADALASENAAATSEANAAASASAASTSETNAAASASAASTSEANAATSATNAATSATAAATSETNAAASASAASTSATNSANSATAAATSAANVAATYDEFDDRYLGSKASAPTLDNDGNALLTGALYYNTTTSRMQVYTGTSWDDVGTATTVTYEYTATEGQTTFSGVDDNGKGLTYNVGFELVFVNGVRYNSSLYTATDGSSIVLDSGLAAGSKVTVVAFGTFSVADAYTRAQADATFASISSSRKNYIINGNFDVWQRGTSQTISGYGSDDRWRNEHTGSTKTHSLQAFTVGQTVVPNNPKYYSRTVVTSVVGASNFVTKYTRIEDVTKLSGKTVTLSFWAKADASKNIALEFIQHFGTGGSPSAYVTTDVEIIALTTSWAKYTVTTTLPSVSGKTLGTDNNDALQVGFWFDAGSGFNSRTNSLGQQSGTFDIAQVQLEEGSTATDYEFRPIGEELLLCQRYYEGVHIMLSTAVTPIRSQAFFKVRKRVVPTITLLGYESGTGGTVNAGTAGAPSLDMVQQNEVHSVQALAAFACDAEL